MKILDDRDDCPSVVVDTRSVIVDSDIEGVFLIRTDVLQRGFAVDVNVLLIIAWFTVSDKSFLSFEILFCFSN